MNDFIKTLQGEKTEKPPVWFMRQAGRYLPEYRELRANVSNFMTAVLTPEVATEITMQPMRRFPQIDAAILFSDILVIPYALGQDVQFVKGEGPQLPALKDNEIALHYEGSRLAPIIETVSRMRAALPPEKTLIGFAGSPFTVACYMIAGSNYDEFTDAKRWAFAEPDRLDDLLDKIAEGTIHYLSAQIDAGANVVQLFESWCGLLIGHYNEFTRFILQPTKKIVSAIKEKYPHIPVIGFPRQAGLWVPDYAEQTGINAVGLDWSADLNWMDANLPNNFPVQGNLDPNLLFIGGQPMEDAVRRIKSQLATRPFIFNLGHGVMQHTPPDHVARVLEVVKE